MFCPEVCLAANAAWRVDQALEAAMEGARQLERLRQVQCSDFVPSLEGKSAILPNLLQGAVILYLLSCDLMKFLQYSSTFTQKML